MKKNVMTALLSVAAALTLVPSLPVSAKNLEWEYDENGKAYWYENDVRQGTYDDMEGILGDGTIRGREIYDPVSDAWYWLDSCYDGAKAVNKEVWIPYTYQDELVKAEDGVGRKPMENSYTLDNYSELIAQSWFPSTQLSEMIERQMLTKSGKWVRYDENGRMMKGWVTIEGSLAQIYPDQAGNTYYYDTITGSMVKDGYFIIDGYWTTFNENGILIATTNPAHDTGVEQVTPDADYSVVTPDMRPSSAEEETNETELKVVYIEENPELTYYEQYKVLNPGEVAYGVTKANGTGVIMTITKTEDGGVAVADGEMNYVYTEKTDTCEYCKRGTSVRWILDNQSYDLLDDNGEVIGHRYKYVCPDCGFTYYWDHLN